MSEIGLLNTVSKLQHKSRRGKTSARKKPATARSAAKRTKRSSWAVVRNVAAGLLAALEKHPAVHLIDLLPQPRTRSQVLALNRAARQLVSACKIEMHKWLGRGRRHLSIRQRPSRQERAKARSRCAPARCAGTWAERPRPQPTSEEIAARIERTVTAFFRQFGQVDLPKTSSAGAWNTAAGMPSA